jgi:DHA1 family bicyclomycin/chloramphenicol resistance-like MFS transporter
VFRPGTFALTILLAGLTAIGPLTTDMYLPSLPDISRVFGASAAQVELTISAYLVGFAVGQLIYGPISDRYGRKPVLLAAIAVFCLASLACVMSASIGMLIAARAVQALGGCGGVVLARAIVRDLYSGARAGRELSLMAMVMALAPVIAPIIGGSLQTAFGWRASFVVLVGGGLALAAVVWWLLPETLDKRAAQPISAGAILRSFHGFTRDRGYVAYTALIVFTYAGLFAWIVAAPFVLQELYGLSSFTFGLAFAAAAAGVMIGSAFGSRFAATLGIDILIGIGTAAQALGGLLLVAAVGFGLRSAASLVIPVAIYLAGLGLVLPQAIAGAMHPYRDRAGAASSLIGFLQQSAAALCGIVVGQLLGDSAWPMAATIAVTGVVTLILWATTRAARARSLHGA